MKNADALVVAERLIGWLKPACERIEVAGSVRRGKPEVKDIEILAIPKSDVPKPVFGQRKVFPRLLEQILYTMETLRGLIEPVKGGEKYKQFWLLDGRVHVIKVDLFLVTPPAQWGVQMVIRTGPGKVENNFSQWVVTQKSKGAALPNGYVVDRGAVWGIENGLQVATAGPMPEEIDFLNFLGLGWIEPGEREAHWHQVAPLSPQATSPQILPKYGSIWGEG